MTDLRDETELRRVFVQLRCELGSLVPDPEQSLVSPTTRPRHRALAPRVAWAGAVGVAVVALLWGAWRWMWPAGQEATPPYAAIVIGDGLWRGPTDFLLEVPGSELLRTAPSIGTALPTLSPRMPIYPVPNDRRTGRSMI